MDVKGFIAHFGITFILALVVSAAVSWLWSLVAHGNGVVDWESSFRLALILGLVIPLATGGHFDHKRNG